MNLDDVYLHGICICDNNDFTDTFSILEKIFGMTPSIKEIAITANEKIKNRFK